jgi:hypothetical protein
MGKDSEYTMTGLCVAFTAMFLTSVIAIWMTVLSDGSILENFSVSGGSKGDGMGTGLIIILLPIGMTVGLGFELYGRLMAFRHKRIGSKGNGTQRLDTTKD